MLTKPSEATLNRFPSIGTRVHFESEQNFAVRNGRHRQTQVLRRSPGDVSQYTHSAGEIEGEVESLEIDSDPVKQCAGSGDAQVPSKILTAVALVCAQAFHRGGHLLAQVTESIVAANRQPERQNVDCHGRRLECRAAYARHEWHRDDNIRLAEQSVEKRAVAGDQCLGPRCSRRVCHLFEAAEGVGGNDLANLDRSFRRTGDLLGRVRPTRAKASGHHAQ